MLMFNHNQTMNLQPIILRIARRSLLVLFALQVIVISVLMAIDSWRKRFRNQGGFPRTRPSPSTIEGVEVQLYTYGEDLYAAMLRSIREAERVILFETFIWKDDQVGQEFKHELIRAAERGVDVYIIFDTFANLVVPSSFKRFPACV